MATDRLSFHPKGLEEDIQEFKEREGIESQAEATRELIRVGVRETRAPILYRLKDEVINWVGWLALSSIVVVVAGLATTVLTPPHAVMVAVVLLSVAVALLATVELMKAVRGQSEIGEHLYGVVGR